MPAQLKNFLGNVLPFILSGALLWWIFTKIDIAHVFQVIKSADFKYILYAFICFLFINAILIARWFIFIKALDLKVNVLTAIRYYLIGLCGNLFLPSAVGGDVIKILGLCTGSQEKPKVVASVLIDRLSGFGGMVVVAVGSMILGYRLIPNFYISLAILAMAAVSFGIGAVLFNETAYSFCCQIFGRFPKFKNSLMKMHYDIALLKDRQDAIYKGVGLSALSQVVLAVTFFLVSKALHQDVSLFYFIIFMPLIGVISTIPSIGGLGVREAGVKNLYGLVGIVPEVAVSISLINFVFMVVVGLLGGVFFFVTRPPKKNKNL